MNPCARAIASRPHPVRVIGRRRSGMTLVYVSLVLSLLLGMAGLVLDGGRMMAERRHAQSAADAGATAAAVEKLVGRSNNIARSTATTFVKNSTHNNLAGATVVVNIPPTSGTYAGNADFIEVVVTHPTPTFFLHVLPGIDRNQTVTVRSVAGVEAVASREVVVPLDPNAWPGLDVSGTLRVDGGIYVNSEGGGVDEEGNPSLTAQNGSNLWAAKAGSSGGVFADNVLTVGGVDSPSQFNKFNPQDSGSPLECNQLPLSDPLISLPSPYTANGVDGANVIGNVTITSQSSQGVPSSWIDGTGKVTMRPGVYASIEITGGNVRFNPGIYVIRGGKPTALKITGGTVTGDGVMFYNTGNNYLPASGSPDRTDPYDPTGNVQPPADQSRFGGVEIFASAQFTPIDTTLYNYSGVSAAISEFNGMVFYQRRSNAKPILITGGGGGLEGTVYAKWGELTMSAQGTFDVQLFARKIVVPGGADLTIDYSGTAIAKAKKVFLVE